jgi:predicted ribosome quality control (RQC) complex YloA/Tae2 family protein
MENLALVALAENLRSAMGDLLIRRVIQHQPNGFTFQTRSPRLPGLKVLMHAQNPAVYPSDVKLPLESPGSDFLMVLRKHLTSAELIDFRKPLSERVLEFVFKTTVPSKELETMSLVVELIPNAANIILLDGARRVLSSFSPITPQHGIGEFDEYAFPSVNGKIDLEHLSSAEAAAALDEAASESDPKSWLLKRVAGLGPVFASEIVHRQRKTGRSISAEIQDIVQQVRGSSHGAWIYTDQPLAHILEQNDLRHLERAVISPIELQSLERTHSSRLFMNILEASRFYFDTLESRTILEHTKLPVMRDLRTVGKRLGDREKRLLREKEKYEQADSTQKTAQMLTSSGMKMDQRYEAVTVPDYFAEKTQQVTIPLDPALTLRENIEKMFKLHQKAGRGKQIVDRQLAAIRNRQGAIAEQVRRLHAVKDWDTWLAIADRISKERHAAAPGEEPSSPGRRRLRGAVVEGREILIGRSSRENDEITFHVASPDDFWLHVAEYSGSHVVVRNPQRDKELPESVLTKAAQLAAYFSQARNSSKVEVHYTRRKHVTKPRRAKPGLVRLLEFKSISVEPKNWLL